ncbi:hypothetical protein [Cohnella candidum]|uniref:ParA family protein n=1 Tax=Cohnella candidum TaxID=2674991 RepID=A0A3G3JZJ5_9BACL|nr:hypothetical protein [Cohnella candidum]AYQ73685.1 hypothetical protein EAV92_14500 [Cohnella candidum]
MNRKIVLAIPNREYAARLAEYLRETEPGWDVTAFTHETALRLRLQEPGGIDALVGFPSLLKQAESWLGAGVRKAALVEDPGQSKREWPELRLYQPLPVVAAGIRGLLSEQSPAVQGGCRWLTVFSASGGAGKTTAALNVVRQAGERGLRTLYLNLETVNVTSRLFGNVEPDSLSRLLYVLQSDSGRFAEQLERSVRHHSILRADIIDAPDHPGERLAMTPELVASLAERLRESGRYDLVVADPDCGATPWHAALLGLSDRVAWLVTDDWQCLGKAEKLLEFWRREAETGWSANVSFVRSKTQGRWMNPWRLPSPPAAELPYVPQWKGTDDPGRIFGSAAYSGGVDALLDGWGWERGRKGALSGGSLEPAAR